MTQTFACSAVYGLRRVLGLATMGIFVVLPIAEANPSRARMSRDLVDRVASGRLDTASIIVSGDAARIQSIAARHGGRVTKVLQHGAVIEVPGHRLQGLSEDPAVDHLSGDVPVRRMMSVTSESVGADQAWTGALTGQGYTGRGVGVAVIDSGVAHHRALRGRIVASLDLTDGRGAARDEHGHGTHIAGIVAGGSDAGYAGVAPGAHIVSLKVLDGTGSGETSNVIAAIDWAVQNRARYNLRVINLSLGHPVFESYRDDPLCQAVERAVKAGLVVVASAGNFGKAEDGRAVVGGIVSPGNSPAALTVGASNTKGTVQRSDDVMATYSSRGPTAMDGLLKPDLVAPGNRVVAAAAVASHLTGLYPNRVVGHGQEAYIELSGTSMSAAVVSGAVALLLEASPHLTPAQAKLALQVTSSAIPGAGLVEAGAGHLNVIAALALVTGEGSGTLPTTIVGLETVASAGISYGSSTLDSLAPGLESNTLVWGNILVWGNREVEGNILVWGNQTVDGNILVWGNQVQIWGNHVREADSTTWANVLVWGNILVWGNQTVEGNILVWGNEITEGNILVWGDILVWGNNAVEGNILVWGNSTVESNILVWGNATVEGNILVWGNTVDGNILVWGNRTVNGHILVWGNQSIEGHILVWGDHVMDGD